MRPLAVVCAIARGRSSPVVERRTAPASRATRNAFNDEQRALSATYSGAFGSGADFRTLLVHPELVKGVLPFANYILSESTLTPRHRDLLILRTAWSTRSDYLWAKHQDRETAPVVTPSARSCSAVRRERSAPSPASDWVNDFERTLLRAADELHESSFITNETWAVLATALQRAPADGCRIHRRGDDDDRGRGEQRARESRAGLRWSNDAAPQRRLEPQSRDAPLATPRIEPVVLAQATPEIRAMLDPSGSGRDIAAVYRTFARHPKLYPPRQILSEYIRTKSTLSPRVREMLILRIGWRCRSAYEWAAHAPAGRRAGLTDDQIRMLARSGYEGWSAADAAIVRAADELFADDTISDATWKALDEQFDEKQLLDVLITTGGYRMVSMVLNTFGVPAEPNSEPFP